MKNLEILSLLLLLVFSSCRKDIEEITITEETPDPTVIEGYEPKVETINGHLIGFVVDENQEPVADAAVKMGNLTTTTDNFGHFFFKSVNMNALGTFVQIQKAGYFEGSRRFFPIAAAKNRVKIELLIKNFNLSFSTETGGTVALPTGASVTFLPNSIKNEDGTLYNGVVKVAAKWMNPTDLRTFDQMPGSLQGVGLSTENEEMVLATYGMMAVELEGELGEKLNIAAEFTATLTMPVSDALQTNAPTEIILWAFNEEYGIWHEQSKAYLINGAYVGEVSHFSFWNCDVPFDAARVAIRLLDENNMPISNVKVELRTANASCAHGYTDENGVVSGVVPSNLILYVWIYDACDNILATSIIGPFDTGSGALIIISSIVNVNNTTITGTLVCDALPINDGVIKISFDGMTEYHFLDDAIFSITTTACLTTTEIEVVGISLADFSQSEVIIVAAGAQNDLGGINICEEEIEEFIELTIDGVTKLYTYNFELITFPHAEIFGSYTFIKSFNLGDLPGIAIKIPGQSTGTYINEALFDVNEFDPNWLIHQQNVPVSSTVTVTEYGEVGGIVGGTFEAVLLNEGHFPIYDPPVEVFVTGSFKVILE